MGGGELMQPPFGFSENNSWTDRPIVIKQLYVFPEHFKPVPTITFDLGLEFQGHVERNLRSVPFQHPKHASFGSFAGDMDMDRCCEVTSMVRFGFGFVSWQATRWFFKGTNPA